MFRLPTAEFLDVVESILVAAGKPVSIEDLVQVLQSLEAIDPDADFKKAKHDVYSKVWMEPKKHGDASRWQRVGKGLWCHVTHITAEMLASDSVTIQTLDEKRTKAKMEGRRPREKREERHVDEADRRCGNCASLRFFGVHFAKLDGGSCERWPESGTDRPYVQVQMLPCELWRRRTAAQHEADRREQANDLVAISGCNAGATYRRGDRKKSLGNVTVHTSTTTTEEETEK